MRRLTKRDVTVMLFGSFFRMPYRTLARGEISEQSDQRRADSGLALRQTPVCIENQREIRFEIVIFGGLCDCPGQRFERIGRTILYCSTASFRAEPPISKRCDSKLAVPTVFITRGRSQACVLNMERWRHLEANGDQCEYHDCRNSCNRHGSHSNRARSDRSTMAPSLTKVA